MKRIMPFATVLAAVLFYGSTTLRAAGTCPVSLNEYDKLIQSSMKNQCLIVAKNCAVTNESVQQRVNELRKEIAKGTDVYTPAELRMLKEQLQWIQSDSSNRFI